jgi:hypothetical protein
MMFNCATITMEMYVAMMVYHVKLNELKLTLNLLRKNNS